MSHHVPCPVSCVLCPGSCALCPASFPTKVHILAYSWFNYPWRCDKAEAWEAIYVAARAFILSVEYNLEVDNHFGFFLERMCISEDLYPKLKLHIYLVIILANCPLGCPAQLGARKLMSLFGVLCEILRTGLVGGKA